MSPYRKGASLVIRMVAFALILFSAIFVASDFFDSKLRRKNDLKIFPLLLKAIPFLAGAALFIKSDALAKKLTEDFDD